MGKSQVVPVASATGIAPEHAENKSIRASAPPAHPGERFLLTCEWRQGERESREGLGRANGVED